MNQPGDTSRVLGIQPVRCGDRRVTFRFAAATDGTLLREIYGSTRTMELAPIPWPAEAKRRFLDQQFAAQDHAYRSNYPGAEFLIIQVDRVDAGRLFLHPRPAEIRIMDIALLPPYRGRGVGTAILQQLQHVASGNKRALSIHVETFNPARRLYARLGFAPVGQTDVYLLLEWKPLAPPLDTAAD